MARIHGQGLLVGHGGEVLHGEQVLRPILKYCAISAIGNEFVRMLCYCRIQVVLNHQHDGGSLFALVRIFFDVTGKYLIIRSQAVHVNSPIGV